MNTNTVLTWIGMVAVIIAISYGVFVYAQNQSGAAANDEPVFTYACQNGCVLALEKSGNLNVTEYQACSSKCEEKYGGK